MTVITIVSDYGWKDPYVAALKGNLLQEIVNPNIVDVSHEVSHFNLREAAYIINNSYAHFPKKTIHLFCIDEAPKKNVKMLALQFKGHFFVSADNGLFSLVLQENTDYKMVEVDEVLLEDTTTAREKFAKIAGHLGRGGQLNLLGRKAKNIMQLSLPKLSLSNSGQTIVGGVTYIDHFGNAVTNISETQFIEMARGKRFEIIIPLVRNPITKVFNGFGEINNQGSIFAVFNDNGWLEIAIYKPNSKTNNAAHSLLALNIDSRITINFKP